MGLLKKIHNNYIQKRNQKIRELINPFIVEEVAGFGYWLIRFLNEKKLATPEEWNKFVTDAAWLNATLKKLYNESEKKEQEKKS